MALGWVHFSQHHRRPRHILRQADFAQARPWARTHEAEVVGDLKQAHGAARERAMGKDASWGASASNVFSAEVKGRPASSATLAPKRLGEFGVGLEPGADRGA